MSSNSQRLIGLDALRGVAFLAMALQHLLFVHSVVFNTFDISYHGTVFWLGRVGAVIFIFLAGCSIALMVGEGKRMTTLEQLRLVLYKSRWIGLAAVAITLTSLLVFPEYAIWFGILHFLFFSRFIVVLTVGSILKKVLLGVFALLVVILQLNTIFTSRWWLLPFGLYPESFASYDYWPLIPWIILTLCGTWATELGLVRRLHQKVFAQSVQEDSILVWIGRHSLALYVLHVPVIYLAWLIVKAVQI